MDIFNAIMRAADVIDSNPALYNFQANSMPECGTPGCLLGRIGAELGYAGQDVFSGDTWSVLGLADANGRRDVLASLGYWDWKKTRTADQLIFAVTDHAPTAAAFLRHVAQRYKPTPLPFVDLPASVRAIFSEGVAA